MKKLQDFNQYRHKTMQIKSYFRFFCLDTKEAKNQGEPSRRPANGSTANEINVSNSILTPSSPSRFPACEVYAVFIC
ncbi:MAG: hypothetical protein LBK94_01050 [Prevotellaceae bacterium]|jgi:hypothetical protein|nr:hypothetical protein [Prevotellaceae bacterium]